MAKKKGGYKVTGGLPTGKSTKYTGAMKK